MWTGRGRGWAFVRLLKPLPLHPNMKGGAGAEFLLPHLPNPLRTIPTLEGAKKALQDAPIPYPNAYSHIVGSSSPQIYSS